jgi:capsular polysaccharide biosynthesis protein
MELQSQLDVLQNKVENAKEHYKRIDDIFLDLTRKEKSVVNNIKILNSPQVPIVPSKNMQFTIILMGLLIGAALGIAPILAWDYFRGNIRHKKDIFSAVNIPIIGRLPTIK